MLSFALIDCSSASTAIGHSISLYHCKDRLSVHFVQTIHVTFPLLLLGLGENTMSLAGNRLLQHSDLLCVFFSSSYRFSVCNSIITIYTAADQRHKEEKYFCVFVATYPNITFANTFSATVYDYTSSRCRVMLWI
jgi:hypothetical protein